jgi:iron complex outermembrane receptor protein
MKSQALKFSLLIGGSLLATLAPSLAYAADELQDADAAVQSEGDSSEGEIIVTATRQSQRLQEVPMSVNVATGEQLEKFKIFDVKDISQLAPGLELTNTTGRNNTTTLRGVTFDPDQGTGPAVRVYLNETPVDAQTAYTAIYDIQQIEVLRGPQGLLRGLSSPAGSITIATRKPGFDAVEGEFQATATDRAGYNVQGGVTLPFSDKLSIRVAGLVDGNRLNHVRDVNRGGERSQSRTESARITVGWRPTDTFNAYLTYQYLTADNRQFQQVVGTGGTPLGIYGTLFGFPSAFILGSFPADTTVRSGPALSVKDRGAVQEGLFRNQNNTHFINLQAEYDLGPATLSFVGAHQFTKLTIARDLDAANAIPGYVQTSSVDTPYKVDTAELRLTSNNTEGLGWGVGAFYTKQTGTTLVNQDNSLFQYNVAANAQVNPSCDLIGASAFCPTGTFAPFTIPNALPLSVFVRVPVNSQTASFNANLSYRAGPLKIEGGLRYSIIKGVQTTQQQLSGAFNTPLIEIIPANLQRNTDHPVTGGATISYEVTPDLNVYAAYGHSFRSGSTKVAGPAFVSSDLIRTNPEKTDSFEVGLKGSFWDRRANFTVSAFYQKLDGFLSRFTSIYYRSANDQPPTGTFDFNYNGDAKIKGIEASLDLRPTENWDLNISGAYTHARWDNARLPCNDYAGTGVPNTTGGVPQVTGTGNVSYCLINDRLANTPDFSLNANTEVRFPLATVTPFVRALVTYTPSYYWWQSQYRFQDRELLNVFVGARSNDGKWEFDVFARNLLNQQRITNISLGEVQTNAVVVGTFTPGYSPVNVTNPREFGITAKFNW